MAERGASLIHLPFHDRREAGRLLAARLAGRWRGPDAVIEALPRGGIPVGREVAEALGAPLDVILVRKLGVPGQEELAFGAISTGGLKFIDQDLVAALQLAPGDVTEVISRQQQELLQREQRYRDGRPPVPLQGKTAILVDDGMATGSTMRVAIQAVAQRGARHVVVAAPVASPQAIRACQDEGAECIVLAAPEDFRAVGEWYEDFSQISEEQARWLLRL